MVIVYRLDGSFWTFISHTRRGDKCPIALKTEPYRHLHIGACFAFRGWNPTGAQSIENIANRIELFVGRGGPPGMNSGVATCITRLGVGGRDDNQLKVLSDRVFDLRYTGTTMEYTADRRGTGMVAEYAADTLPVMMMDAQISVARDGWFSQHAS